MRNYVKICDICQRIKISRHKSYKKLKFLSTTNISWKKIIMNFVTSLFSSKRRDIVYDFILIMINRCIKMIKYILVIIKIIVVKLTKFFFEKIVLRYNVSNDIMSDKKFVFINAFWLIIYYYAKIKRKLNIVFYFQINEQIERQNQVLKHYFRIFVDVEQTQWINQLSLIEFVYNNANHNFIDCSSFYLLYDFNSKIHYEIENDFVEKKILAIRNRIKYLHEIKQILTKWLKYVNFKQTKYCNKKHKFIKYYVNDLIMLLIKNFNQKRFNKKMSHKFVKFFKVENKIVLRLLFEKIVFKR